MALRGAILLALLAGGSPLAAPAAAQGTARQTARDGVPSLPDHPVPPFTPAPPPPGPADVWIFSGLLDDGRETYSGTLLTGSGATGFEFKLGAGVSCTGGDTKTGPGSLRLSDVVCSDDRRLQAFFVFRDDAELTVFGQVGAQRFTASAHRLGTEASPDDAKPGDAKARDAAPPAAPPAGPDPSRPRNG